MRSEFGRGVAGRQPLFSNFFHFFLNAPAKWLSQEPYFPLKQANGNLNHCLSDAFFN